MEEREPFEGKDIVMEPWGEKDMRQCSGCSHSMDKSVECEIYSRKPSGVILGEADCSRYEAR